MTTRRFVSSFRHRWNYITTIRQLQAKHRRAMLDILSYRAASPSSVRSLIKARLSLLGRETGYPQELEELERANELERNVKYEQFLLDHYNISRQDAAAMMDRAMQQEERRYGFGKRKR